jgi:hypothetical protein
MNELHIRPMEADEEGWTEIVMIQSAATDPQEPVGETIGFLRVVEGTEEGPHTWWDARVIEDNKRLQRRFIGYEAAILALALRHAAPDVRSLTWE